MCAFDTSFSVKVPRGSDGLVGYFPSIVFWSGCGFLTILNTLNLVLFQKFIQSVNTVYFLF